MRRLMPAVMMLLCCFLICSSHSNPHDVALVKSDTRLQVIQHSDGGSVVAGKFPAGRAMTGKNNGKFRVIVYSSNIQDALQIGVQPRTVTHEFFTAEATLDQIARLSKLGSVRRIALAKKYKPLLDLSVPEIHADQLQNGNLTARRTPARMSLWGLLIRESTGAISIFARRPTQRNREFCGYGTKRTAAVLTLRGSITG